MMSARASLNTWWISTVSSQDFDGLTNTLLLLMEPPAELVSVKRRCLAPFSVCSAVFLVSDTVQCLFSCFLVSDTVQCLFSCFLVSDR